MKTLIFFIHNIRLKKLLGKDFVTLYLTKKQYTRTSYNIYKWIRSQVSLQLLLIAHRFWKVHLCLNPCLAVTLDDWHRFLHFSMRICQLQILIQQQYALFVGPHYFWICMLSEHPTFLFKEKSQNLSLISQQIMPLAGTCRSHSIWMYPAKKKGFCINYQISPSLLVNLVQAQIPSKPR